MQAPPRCLAADTAITSSNDINNKVFAETRGGSAPCCRSPHLCTGLWRLEVDAELAQLQSDKALLLAHWQTQDGVVGATAPVRARACGQPEPCPHVLGLAQRYGPI